MTDNTETKPNNIIMNSQYQQHNNIMDTMMSTYLSSFMMKIMNSNNKLSIRNIWYLIVICSMTEIKGLVTSLLSHIRTKVDYSEMFNNQLYLMRIRKRIEMPSYDDDDMDQYDEVNDTNCTIDLVLNNQMMEALLIHYTDDLGNELEVANNLAMDYTDCQDPSVKIVISNFSFDIPEICTVHLPNNLEISRKYNGEISSMNTATTVCSSEPIYDDMKSLLNLINDKIIHKKIRNVYIKFRDNSKCTDNLVNYVLDKTYILIQYNRLEWLECIISQILSEVICNVGNTTIRLTLITIFLTIAMKNSNKKQTLIDIVESMKQGIFTIPCLTINCKNDKLKKITLKHLGNTTDYSKINLHNGQSSVLYKRLEDYGYVFEKQNNSNTSMAVSLVPLQQISNNELIKQFHNYMNTIIAKHQQIQLEKQTAYLLKVEFENKEIQVSNPKYEQYISENKSDDDSDEKPEKPPQHITVIEKIHKIVQTKIREFNKPMDTLYLREHDKTNMLTMLKAFNNRNELFERLGIPKKLGILGYGEPGTGKTSTILAIANYLNLNIYYIDLKNVKTNEQLKELFDTVIKNSVNNGIIVFEDIDAMTDIVHKRETSSPTSNTTSVLSETNDKISLSYLLNLLDGTLCQENTIFIMTTNHKECLDPAIYRKGRIDIEIEFKKCDRYQIRCIYEQIMERAIPEQLLERIKEDEHTPADIIFHLIKYLYRQVSDEEILADFLE
jgi:hypothetical protein